VPGKRSTEEEWARTGRQSDLGRGTYEVILKNLERMFLGNISWHWLYRQPSNIRGEVVGLTRTKNESNDERDIE
jgi:hypothetical protein